jgi:hypothetical protein
MLASSTHIPSSESRSPVEVTVGGANRGARTMQRAIADFNRTSARFALAPTYVDPVPERALALVREGATRGIRARAVEARIEEVLSDDNQPRSPLIVSVDNPHAVASALERAEGRPILVYLLVRMPSQELMGIRVVIRSGDDQERALAARFFRALGKVTARSGASVVIGVNGRPEHVALEPAYRAWFAEHMQSNMTKLVANIAPENDPLEVTFDGRKTMSLMVKESGATWSDPSELARAVVEHPLMPITRGRDFAIGELGPDGVRMHVLRVRATDGKPAIKARAVVTPEAYRAADVEEREAIRRELAAAMGRAALATLGVTLAIFTTD